MPDQQAAAGALGKLSPDASYERLGGIVRQLHDALRSLGHDEPLRRIAREIPDARDRLAYVGNMTEAAAHRVLNLVDGAAPGCDDIAERTEHLGARIRQLGGPTGTDDAAPPLLAECADFAAHVGSFAETQRSVLTDIMLAQDFQDLSGQVIGKIIDIITRTEQQLLDLLVHSAPGETGGEEPQLEGPQIPEKAMKQDDVDDLLASLGF